MLGPSKGYIDILDEYIIQQKLREQSEPIKYNPLRASSAGFCERALGYSYDEYKGLGKFPFEPPNADLVRLFDLGRSVEYSFIRSLEFSKLFQVKYKQQALTFLELGEGEIIEGSIDLCVYFEEHKCVADVKSKGSKFSSFFSDSWIQIDNELMEWASVQKINDRVYWINDLDLFLKECNDEFMKDNFYQLNLYANSQFLKERGVNHAVLFYYEKNKSRLREIRFRPSQKAYEYVIEKFQRIHKKETELSRESSLGSTRCAFCRFASVCRPGIDTKQAFFDTWPKFEKPVDCPKDLEVLYSLWKTAKSHLALSEDYHEELCRKLEERKISKVKFEDGETHELKLLKSPKPHFELRRVKSYN